MYFPFLKRLILFLVTTLTATIVPASAATVTIDPKSRVTVPINGVRQFTATATGTTNTTVTWSLIPPTGVNPSAIGTIDATGKYTAPPNPLSDFASLTVKVTNVADPTRHDVAEHVALAVRPHLSQVVRSDRCTTQQHLSPVGQFCATRSGIYAVDKYVARFATLRRQQL